MRGLDGDEATGARTVFAALEAPARLIADNAGLEGAVTVRQTESEDGPVGLNAATGDFEDLVKAGVIDPAKVTRAALQNAASIAGLVLTTESLGADKPELEEVVIEREVSGTRDLDEGHASCRCEQCRTGVTR